MNSMFSVCHLSDAELLVEVKARAGRECSATAALVAALAELDARRLYLSEGYSSLFTYCTQLLHLSEHAAYGRIEAARAARRCPAILGFLVDGSITLTLLLAEVEKRKLAAVVKPRKEQPTPRGSTRHIPASVRRAVWKRDGGRCAFVGTRGRCAERGFLEFHHREPFAAGGGTTIDNLELRCRAHNAYEAELFFGPYPAREDRAVFEGVTRSGPS